MTDYGHRLRFGAFITPDAADPIGTVDLAVRAEDAGLDLVTFQDHPYQPAFLDAWTLLSWVAARTERVHLSGNVLNLPLRQPAVLARAAASLDLLSRGRVELGLGTGAYWDAIVAMGASRRTPAESVTALEEAIEVIRGIWDTDDRRPLRAGGSLVHVDGAKRGPAPFSPIPIVLGAYKPRMLRLTGSHADGWLPTLGYLQPGDLQRANAVIDDAATEADRRPGDITRWLNVPADLDARALADFAVEDGISTFIVATDDPAALTRFGRITAHEVAVRVNDLRRQGGSPVSRASVTDPPWREQ